MQDATLYLLATEQSLFDALADALKSGVVVEEEQGTYVESYDRMVARSATMEISSPLLQVIQEKMQSVSNKEEFVDVCNTIAEEDFDALTEEEVIEVFFAAGPAAMGTLLCTLLEQAETTDDIERAIAVSQFRHIFLQSHTTTAV